MLRKTPQQSKLCLTAGERRDTRFKLAQVQRVRESACPSMRKFANSFQLLTISTAIAEVMKQIGWQHCCCGRRRNWNSTAGTACRNHQRYLDGEEKCTHADLARLKADLDRAVGLEPVKVTLQPGLRRYWYFSKI